MWSKPCTLHFSADADPFSKIDDSSSSTISVTSLDVELANKEPTFIKMDIEGSEYEALIGATNIIKTYKPKLAISIYHKKEDIYILPNLLLEFNPNYRFYLRHYSLGQYDTVLYAL